MVIHLRDPQDPLKLAGCKCPDCGYALKGATGCCCPECGRAFTLQEVKDVPPPREVGTFIALVVCGVLLLACLAVGRMILWSPFGGPLGMMMIGLGVAVVCIAVVYKVIT